MRLNLWNSLRSLLSFVLLLFVYWFYLNHRNLSGVDFRLPTSLEEFTFSDTIANNMIITADDNQRGKTTKMKVDDNSDSDDRVLNKSMNDDASYLDQLEFHPIDFIFHPDPLERTFEHATPLHEEFLELSRSVSSFLLDNLPIKSLPLSGFSTPPRLLGLAKSRESLEDADDVVFNNHEHVETENGGVKVDDGGPTSSQTAAATTTKQHPRNEGLLELGVRIAAKQHDVVASEGFLELGSDSVHKSISAADRASVDGRDLNGDHVLRVQSVEDEEVARGEVERTQEAQKDRSLIEREPEHHHSNPVRKASKQLREVEKKKAQADHKASVLRKTAAEAEKESVRLAEEVNNARETLEKHKPAHRGQSVLDADKVARLEGKIGDMALRFEELHHERAKDVAVVTQRQDEKLEALIKETTLLTAQVESQQKQLAKIAENGKKREDAIEEQDQRIQAIAEKEAKPQGTIQQSRLAQLEGEKIEEQTEKTLQRLQEEEKSIAEEDVRLSYEVKPKLDRVSERIEKHEIKKRALAIERNEAAKLKEDQFREPIENTPSDTLALRAIEDMSEGIYDMCDQLEGGEDEEDSADDKETVTSFEIHQQISTLVKKYAPVDCAAELPCDKEFSKGDKSARDEVVNEAKIVEPAGDTTPYDKKSREWCKAMNEIYVEWDNTFATQRWLRFVPNSLGREQIEASRANLAKAQNKNCHTIYETFRIMPQSNFQRVEAEETQRSKDKKEGRVTYFEDMPSGATAPTPFELETKYYTDQQNDHLHQLVRHYGAVLPSNRNAFRMQFYQNVVYFSKKIDFIVQEFGDRQEEVVQYDRLDEEGNAEADRDAMAGVGIGGNVAKQVMLQVDQVQTTSASSSNSVQFSVSQSSVPQGEGVQGQNARSVQSSNGSGPDADTSAVRSSDRSDPAVFTQLSPKKPTLIVFPKTAIGTARCELEEFKATFFDENPLLQACCGDILTQTCDAISLKREIVHRSFSAAGVAPETFTGIVILDEPPRDKRPYSLGSAAPSGIFSGFESNKQESPLGAAGPNHSQHGIPAQYSSAASVWAQTKPALVGSSEGEPVQASPQQSQPAETQAHTADQHEVPPVPAASLLQAQSVLQSAAQTEISKKKTKHQTEISYETMKWCNFIFAGKADESGERFYALWERRRKALPSKIKKVLAMIREARTEEAFTLQQEKELEDVVLNPPPRTHTNDRVVDKGRVVLAGWQGYQNAKTVGKEMGSTPDENPKSKFIWTSRKDTGGQFPACNLEKSAAYDVGREQGPVAPDYAENEDVAAKPAENAAANDRVETEDVPAIVKQLETHSYIQTTEGEAEKADNENLKANKVEEKREEVKRKRKELEDARSKLRTKKSQLTQFLTESREQIEQENPKIQEGFKTDARFLKAVVEDMLAHLTPPNLSEKVFLELRHRAMLLSHLKHQVIEEVKEKIADFIKGWGVNIYAPAGSSIEITSRMDEELEHFDSWLRRNLAISAPCLDLEGKGCRELIKLYGIYNSHVQEFIEDRKPVVHPLKSYLIGDHTITITYEENAEIMKSINDMKKYITGAGISLKRIARIQRERINLILTDLEVEAKKTIELLPGTSNIDEPDNVNQRKEFNLVLARLMKVIRRTIRELQIALDIIPKSALVANRVDEDGNKHANYRNEHFVTIEREEVPVGVLANLQKNKHETDSEESESGTSSMSDGDNDTDDEDRSDDEEDTGAVVFDELLVEDQWELIHYNVGAIYHFAHHNKKHHFKSVAMLQTVSEDIMEASQRTRKMWRNGELKELEELE